MPNSGGTRGSISRNYESSGAAEPTIEPRARNPLLAALRTVKNSTQEPAALGWINLRDYVAAGPLRATYTLFLAVRDRLEDKLPRINVPTLSLM